MRRDDFLMLILTARKIGKKVWEKMAPKIVFNSSSTQMQILAAPLLLEYS